MSGESLIESVDSKPEGKILVVDFLLHHKMNLPEKCSDEGWIDNPNKEVKRASQIRVLKHRILLYSLNLWTITSLAWTIIATYILIQVAAIPYDSGGKESEKHFLESAVILVLFGTCLLILSALGHLCQHFKLNPSSSPFFNAEHIFIFFLCIMIIIILFEISGVSAILAVVLTSINNPQSVHDIEHLYSYVFNTYFFISIGANNAIDPSRFWNWIRDNCPQKIHKDFCIKPLYYSVSNCGADMYTCNQQEGFGYACPYNICRLNVLNFSNVLFIYLCAVFLLFIILHIISVIAGMYALNEVESDNSDKDFETLRLHELSEVDHHASRESDLSGGGEHFPKDYAFLEDSCHKLPNPYILSASAGKVHTDGLIADAAFKQTSEPSSPTGRRQAIESVKRSSSSQDADQFSGIDFINTGVSGRFLRTSAEERESSDKCMISFDNPDVSIKHAINKNAAFDLHNSSFESTSSVEKYSDEALSVVTDDQGAKKTASGRFVDKFVNIETFV